MQDFMVVSTLMLGVTFAMIYQGTIPEGIAVEMLRTYTFFLGLALFLLFMSLWFALQLQDRLSSWMNGCVVVYTQWM